jgi:hypothetical protein
MIYFVLSGLCLLGLLLLALVIVALGNISQSADLHIPESKP